MIKAISLAFNVTNTTFGAIVLIAIFAVFAMAWRIFGSIITFTATARMMTIFNPTTTGGSRIWVDFYDKKFTSINIYSIKITYKK